ncbi:MAG: ABC transporter substrate-binding protein [Actinomycetota bacterium]|nr:ABC transporter substrate-binding protein [Actinomycetota bacterium]
MKLRSLVIAIPVIAILTVACGKSEVPNLIEAPTVITPTPVVKAAMEELVNESVESDSNGQAENAFNTKEIERNYRGINDETIKIAVIKSGNVFQDLEIGVEARIFRLNENGGVNSRKLEIVKVIDDSGSEETLKSAVEDIVDQDIFAIILLSTATSPAVSDILAENNMPFFGWGFTEGFCEPNKWGFGFNGCMNLATSSANSENLDTSSLRLLSIFYGRVPQVISITTSDSAGTAVTLQNETLWGDNLVKSIQLEDDISAAAILEEINSLEADVLLLSIGLDTTVAIKRELIDNFSGMVVDDVTYLPGILQDYEIATELEGGYVFSQVPPQEEYRGATTEIMTGLSQIDGPQIYSQAISVGYWSTDLLVAILNSIEGEVSVKSFFEKANIEGYLYSPEFSGGPCPFQTALSHQGSSGGAALLQVRGGVFRPVVNFNCP